MFTCLLLLLRRMRDRRRECPPGGSGPASPSARRAHHVGDDVDLKKWYPNKIFFLPLWFFCGKLNAFLPALGIRWLSSFRPRCCWASEGSGAAEKREDDETKTIYFPPKMCKKNKFCFTCRAAGLAAMTSAACAREREACSGRVRTRSGLNETYFIFSLFVWELWGHRPLASWAFVRKRKKPFEVFSRYYRLPKNILKVWLYISCGGGHTSSSAQRHHTLLSLSTRFKDKNMKFSNAPYAH